MNIVESIGSWGVVIAREFDRMCRPCSGDAIDVGYELGLYPFQSGRYARIELERQADDILGAFDVCCEQGSAYLRSDGSVSISGGPFTRIHMARLEPMHELRSMDFWNWGPNSPGADQGVHYTIARPVFRLLPLTAQEYFSRAIRHISVESKQQDGCPACTKTWPWQDIPAARAAIDWGRENGFLVDDVDGVELTTAGREQVGEQLADDFEKSMSEGKEKNAT